jgi:two-component system OmpR family response regulator
MKKKILIADDTKNIRILLTTCLELRGYEVISTDNGRTAFEIINEEKQNLELIFLDIRMPELTGTDVLRKTREMNITCPVIIMTAFATVKNAVDCTKLGAVTYLQKPFSLARINLLLDNLDEMKNQNLNNAENEYFYILEAEKNMDQGNLIKAFIALKTALSINPYNPKTYYFLGKYNELDNNLLEANRFYSIAKLFNE